MKSIVGSLGLGHMLQEGMSEAWVLIFVLVGTVEVTYVVRGREADLTQDCRVLLHHRFAHPSFQVSLGISQAVECQLPHSPL